MNERNQALTGAQNKRLNNVDATNNSYTSPMTDIKTENVDGTTIPPQPDIVHAKEWVDDGSLL